MNKLIDKTGLLHVIAKINTMLNKDYIKKSDLTKEYLESILNGEKQG